MKVPEILTLPLLGNHSNCGFRERNCPISLFPVKLHFVRLTEKLIDSLLTSSSSGGLIPLQTNVESLTKDNTIKSNKSKKRITKQPIATEKKTCTDVLPKFLFVTSPRHALGNLSPFLIRKGFRGIGGDPKSVKKLKSGDFLIEDVTTVAKMDQIKYTIRKMTAEDIPLARTVWREIEYPEGTHCLYTWFEVDKDAVNIAVTDTGEFIGSCSAVIHHDDLAFLGMYIVRKQYRGLGIGKKLWDACMAHIGSRNGVLNAVPDKTELYRTRGGFPVLDTSCTAVENLTCDPVNHEALSDKVPAGVDIQAFQESHLPAMFQYDLSLMGYKRELALELNFKEQDSSTFVAFKEGKCVGFGTIKTSWNGFAHVGPLYADDPQVAEVILKRLIVSLPKAKGFAMMTVSTNLATKDMIHKLGCPEVEECPRLSTKEKLHVDADKVFAHFDLNFSPF